MMTIVVSAPGKIHLMGEHVVVYGKPALLAAIDKRVYVEIKSQNKNEFIIHTNENDALVKHAISEFKKVFHIEKLPSCEITITSGIPVGSGLGSSAAVVAGVLGALSRFVKNLWNPTHINEMTFTVEKYAHGNPSGADNSTIIFGGLVWFRREFDFLKSIWSLPMTQYHIPRFYLIDSGKPVESTKEMVSLVHNSYMKNKKNMEYIFSDQEVQTKRMLMGLKKGDSQEVEKALIKGEENLEKIGVVSKSAKTIIQELKRDGIAAKICGAGGRKKGSGIILCLKKSANLSSYPITLGEEGIRIERIAQ